MNLLPIEKKIIDAIEQKRLGIDILIDNVPELSTDFIKVFLSLKCKNKKIIRKILSIGNMQDIDIHYDFLYHYTKAPEPGYFMETLKLLLQRGVSPSSLSYNYPFSLVFRLQHKALSLLLDFGLNADSETFVNNERFSLLTLTVKQKKYSMAKNLIDKGANPNIQFFDGKSALEILSTRYAEDSYNMLLYLLEHGADPNLLFSTGKNLLFTAMMSKNYVLVKTMIINGEKYGVDLAATDSRGRGLSYYSNRYEMSKMITLALLENSKIERLAI